MRTLFPFACFGSFWQPIGAVHSVFSFFYCSPILCIHRGHRGRKRPLHSSSSLDSRMWSAALSPVQDCLPPPPPRDYCKYMYTGGGGGEWQTIYCRIFTLLCDHIQNQQGRPRMPQNRKTVGTNLMQVTFKTKRFLQCLSTYESFFLLSMEAISKTWGAQLSLFS